MTSLPRQGSGLVLASRKKHSKAVESLRNAMRKIELEIGENDGVYPFNGGRLNQNEVCRRAGVNHTTLQRDAHKTTTRIEIQDWLKVVNKRRALGNKEVRKAVTDKIYAWKQAYEALAQQYAEAELEYADANAENETLRKELLERDKEIEELREAASSGKVVPFSGKSKRDNNEED